MIAAIIMIVIAAVGLVGSGIVIAACMIAGASDRRMPKPSISKYGWNWLEGA